MGLDYSFVLVSTAANFPNVVTALAAKLARPSRRRLPDLSELEPECEELITDRFQEVHVVRLGLALQSREPCEQQNYYCLSLLPEVDVEVERYVRSLDRCDQEDGRWAIGCVWTSIYRGEQSCLLQAMAATSDMSRLFEGSQSVQRLFQDVAQTAGSTSVFLDTEDLRDWEQLFPVRSVCPKPDFELFENDRLALDVDALVDEAERLSGRDLCGPSGPA